jgi:signal transduction histidine kinase/ActR/RegA family two-component response regulator
MQVAGRLAPPGPRQGFRIGSLSGANHGERRMPRDEPEARRARPAPLQRRLLLLAAVAILPLAIMSGVALRALWQQQQLQVERSTVELTRALATAVDAELRLTISALQALALTEPLDSADPARLAAAYRLSGNVLASRPEWRAILLARPSGEPVFDTASRLGASVPPISDVASFQDAVRTRQPVVGSLARGTHGSAGIAVRVPVERHGELLYVLSAVVRPEAILQVIKEQRIPDEWVVSVFDANNSRVARSREHDKYLGTQASPTLQALIARNSDAVQVVGPTATLDGQNVYSAVSRIHVARWTIALGEPTTIAEAALRDSQLAFGGGILFSLGLGALAAWLVSRRIAGPIARLRESALALGRGDRVERAGSDVLELEAVSDALVGAAGRRAANEAERQHLLDAERQARALAEQAQGRLQRLASASSLLSRSLEEKTTLAAIASVIVPDIADVCRIDLLDNDGVLQRKLTHHLDPSRADEIARFVSQGAVRADTVGSFPWAIATGKTYLENFGSPDAAGGDDPIFRGFAQTVGMRAVCVVPLVARGRTIGAIAALQAESKRSFSSGDGALIGELAQRAALALDNVRLFGESEAARQQAEVANRAKDEFIAMLGHELRNPLAPIATSLELMDRLPGQPAATERRIIGRQVAHLSRMVDDLLDISRITSGKVELRRARVDLREVVASALEQTEPVLRQRRVPPQVTMPGSPVIVMGDPLRLTQVMCNLLTNAAKFSTGEQRIGIELRQEGGLAQLVVDDDGIGIAADLLPRIFERFVQGEQPLQRARGGLGLGLAIARNLVELHGGTIRAESAGTGRGSRFLVTLPEVSVAGLPPAAPAAGGAATRRPARLLVVDDNDDAAHSLIALLELEGHEARGVASAEAALRLLDEFVPQAAILDLGLPAMNGYELAAALRADPRTRQIRLVALTGYGSAADRRRALEAGFDEHSVKPVDIDALLATLDRLLAGEAAPLAQGAA